MSLLIPKKESYYFPKSQNFPVVSASELMCKQILNVYFSNFKHLDNIKPTWLNGMELDRYYPDLGFAIEFQGIQHYRPTKEYQSTRGDFFKRVDLDTQKIQLASRHGVKIFALSLNDILESNYLATVKRLANYAAWYTQSQKNTILYTRLMSINWLKKPDAEIFKKLKGIVRSTKWQVGEEKEGMLKKVFRYFGKT